MLSSVSLPDSRILTAVLLMLVGMTGSSSLSAQSPMLQWSTTATGALIDTAFASAERSDGTIVVVGSTSSGRIGSEAVTLRFWPVPAGGSGRPASATADGVEAVAGLADADGLARFELDGLEPAASYAYAVDEDDDKG